MAHEVVKGFVDRTDRVLALIEGFVPEAAWLSDTETLTYLHACISTKRHRVRVPDIPMYLDAILVDEPLIGGLAPRLGSAHLRILTIMGFPAADLSRHSRRAQPTCLPLSLVDSRHLPRQDRRHQDSRRVSAGSGSPSASRSGRS